MASREPTAYNLFTSPVTSFTWTAYGSTYTLRELAYRQVAALTGVGYRVKVEVTYPNGIVTHRVFEGAHRVQPAGVYVPDAPSPAPAPTPSPSPSPTPSPPPPPPAPSAPALDFSEATNSMYLIII